MRAVSMCLADAEHTSIERRLVDDDSILDIVARVGQHGDNGVLSGGQARQADELNSACVYERTLRVRK